MEQRTLILLNTNIFLKPNNFPSLKYTNILNIFCGVLYDFGCVPCVNSLK